MKYLKRFNEELKPKTYMSAARKIDKMGHTDRSEDLKKWAKKVELDENVDKWKKRLNDFSKFGIFKMNVVNPETGEKLVGDFAIDIHFDEMAFEDNAGYIPQGETGEFGFFMGIIPTSEELLLKCEEVMPEPDLGNGFYWASIFSIDYQIENNREVKLTKWNLFNYDEGLSGEISFADRQSAQRFKNLLKRCITDREFDYPSGYNNAINIQEVMERSILVSQSFSIDYGFELEDISDFINKISPNELYKTI
jgi:hypothetical protein